MAHSHPIGDDHPFRELYALAQAQNLHSLEIVDVYDGALIRLFTRSPDICFKLEGDPGSAMDRQRFDYSEHIRIAAGPPEEMLAQIRKHITEEGLS